MNPSNPLNASNPLYVLNEWFSQLHKDEYRKDILCVEYKFYKIYIKIQENDLYTYMDHQHIVVDLTSENMARFFLNPYNGNYESISIFHSQL